jgi:hypothetical protein
LSARFTVKVTLMRCVVGSIIGMAPLQGSIVDQRYYLADERG